MAATVYRQRLLFLAPVLPSDRGNGLSMRAGFFLDAYSCAFDIDLAVIPIAGPTGPITDFIRRRVNRIEILPIERDTSHTLDAAFREPMERFDALGHDVRPSLTGMLSLEARRKLLVLIDSATHDVVHLSRLYLAVLVAPWITARKPRARFIIDCDEDDVRAHRRISAIERRRGNNRVADWAQAEAAGFEGIARRWLRFFDFVFAASPNEARSLACYRGGGPIRVIPNVAPAVSRRRTTRPHVCVKIILFVGTMGYAPNRDGILWFTSSVWPRLRRALRSSARVLIVGQQPPPEIINLGRRSDIIVTGWVPDVRPFYEIADLAIVPIRAGGGTRIKILEAAAFGVPVVSTTFGAEGLALRRSEEVMTADSAVAFSKTCVKLLTDKNLASRIASRARCRVRWDYDGGTWARKVVQLALSRSHTTDLKQMVGEAASTDAVIPALVSRAQDLDIKEVADGYIIYQRSRDRVHYLNKTAAIVFEFCDTEHTVESVVARVAQVFGLEQTAHGDIRNCVDAMLDEGLLQRKASK